MLDERINENKVEAGIGDKSHKRFKISKQEDCAVIGYPGEHFLGHIVPEGGKGVELARSLDNFIQEREIDIEDLDVIFADGCNKMGGFNHGFIAEFERLQNWPLLHVHCLFQSLEVIFRHIFVNFAGPTTGPNSWSGEEAKRLAGNVWELEVVEFEPVPSPVLQSLLEDIPHSVLKEFNMTQGT